MKFVNEWTALLKTPAWTPVPELPFTTSHVDGTLYQLSETAFLVAVSIGPDLRPAAHANATIVLWAPNCDIARRLVLFQIEADQGVPPTSPPDEILGVRPTYGDIVNCCRTRSDDPISFHATYRVATDGRHICTTIRQGGVEFAFRSVNPKQGEPVVGIKIPLPGANRRLRK